MNVSSSQGSYAIFFSPIEQILSNLPSDSFVITDLNVEGHYGSLLPKQVLYQAELRPDSRPFA